MKYIRTSGGKIFKTEDLEKVEDERFPNGYLWNGVPFIAVDESDRIEDLFDEFAVVAKFYDKPNILRGFVSLPMDIDFKNHELYGLIWTDWGLKYVAKYNKEKEEFEIL